ncbi:MAG: hypothetical protein ACP5VE_13960 [Chthonomonadales bacterium]
MPVQDAAAAKQYTWAAFAILALSLAIVVVGMVWTWRVGQTSNRLYHRLVHLQEATATLRSEAAKITK